MALIRVSGYHDLAAHPPREEDLILNTAHVIVAYPDSQKPARGTLVLTVHGDKILVNMPFEDFWLLIQRET